jgi:hypothetical protein
MNKMNYIEPFFKVVNAKSEDVITTSVGFVESAFSQANGFSPAVESYSASSSTGFGGTTSTGIEI